MARNQPAADSPATDRSGTWREMAVARSLDPARARAEQRVQRFLDAALELMHSDSEKEFTVQDVVERSGQSLRSFYQYFAGKHELLLALFEESVRSTAEQLQETVNEIDDPFERLHRFVVDHYIICRPPVKGKSGRKPRPTPVAMAEFAQQLLTEHPKEASQAFVPMITLLEQLLADAEAAGGIQPGLPRRRVAGIVLQAIMFNVFAATISGSSIRPDPHEAAEELWGLLLHGIGADTRG
jgi:AcrR family transcriptional regulator